MTPHHALRQSLKKATHHASRLAPYAIFAAAAVGATAASFLCARGRYTEAAAALAAMLATGLIISARVSIESILIAWFVTSPLASFYVQFPREKTLITYDRAVFALAALMVIAKCWTGASERVSDETGKPMPKPFFLSHSSSSTGSAQRVKVSRFEIIWAALAALALLSVVMNSNDTGYAMKIAVDAFWLPLIAFHIARWHFDVRGRIPALTIGAIALALFLFGVGGYEFLTGANLFPYRGSNIMREGEIRANGPFASDSSYAIICSMLALFLMMIPKAVRTNIDASARFARVCAVLSAIAASLLPLFRAVAAGLFAGWLIIGLGNRKAIKRRSADAIGREDERAEVNSSSLRAIGKPQGVRLLAAFAMIMILGIMAVTLNASAIGERLASLRNLYGRLATWEAAIGIAIDNPFSGVGLMNYNDYFEKKYFDVGRPVEAVLDTRAASFPHSNLLWIAAELGLFAFALYIIANIYIFLMGYRGLVKARSYEGRAAAACYIAIATAYSIPGLTLASGAYSDLNLYFFFMIGLLLNISNSHNGLHKPEGKS